MGEEFNWSDVEDDLVLSGQLAVAVYENPKGDTVIRQEADHSRDEDSVIIINRGNLAAFVTALQNHLKAQQEHGGVLPIR
jgi:hypothetical protein